MNLELPVHFWKKHVSLLSEGNKLEGFFSLALLFFIL